MSDSISIHLHALHHRLELAAAAAKGSIQAEIESNRNLAIGTILDLEQLLPECEALYRTILLLHRSRFGDRRGKATTTAISTTTKETDNEAI